MSLEPIARRFEHGFAHERMRHADEMSTRLQLGIVHEICAGSDAMGRHAERLQLRLDLGRLMLRGPRIDDRFQCVFVLLARRKRGEPRIVREVDATDDRREGLPLRIGANRDGHP